MTADKAYETMLARGQWHHILNAERNMIDSEFYTQEKYISKTDKILSQTYNNYKTASPPTDQCNKCFLKGLKSGGI